MMHYYRQTTPANCFAACVATILQIPIGDVPESCDGATWDFDSFQRWLARARRMQAIEVYVGENQRLYPVQRPVLCILTGKSPRECLSGQHAVVGRLIGLEGFELVHDPHADGTGIVGDPLIVTFFVPIEGADS